MTNSLIWTQFEFRRWAFVPAQVIYKFDKDQKNTEHIKTGEIISLIFRRSAAGYPKLISWPGQNSKSSEILCMPSLFAGMNMTKIRSKLKAFSCPQHLVHQSLSPK